jgi:hypothetical protein
MMNLEVVSKPHLRLPPAAGLRFPDLSRHSPTLVGGRRRIGLRLMHTLIYFE